MSLRPALLALALALAVLTPAAVDPPAAEAKKKNCGEDVIAEYFFSGRIKYHPQECYALALKQVDPDAKMYSGIMSAIRAARARDKATDEAAAQPADDGGESAPSGPAEPVLPMVIDGETVPMETVPVQEAPVPDEAVDDPVIAEVAAVDLTEDQAVVAVPVVAERVPLPMVLLGLLAAVLTLVGLGGLAVRWIDRTD
jgi:hypothetical protein